MGRSGRGRAVVVDEVVVVAQGVAQGVDRGGVDSRATLYRLPSSLVLSATTAVCLTALVSSASLASCPWSFSCS